ncbi:hypothetical protein MHYP_G00062350 [Metynnis hypsauchen]
MLRRLRVKHHLAFCYTLVSSRIPIQGLRTLSRVLRMLLQQRHLVRNVGVKNKNSRHPSGQHAAPSSTAAKFTSQTQRNPPPSTSRSKETHRTAELHQTAAAKSATLDKDTRLKEESE